ncbi:MAG: type I-A CRISPR-associated protein Cas5a [Thermoproteus sp.]
MKALVVRLQIHWGFSVKMPNQSAAQFAVYMPPPTTLVGALAYACGYKRDAGGDAGELLRDVRWASFGFLEDVDVPLDVLVVGDFNKNLIAPYQRSDNRMLDMAFGVQAMEKVYAPGFEALAVYFGDVERYKDCAWSIVRLGNKEALTNVLDVEVCDVARVGAGVFKTPLYVNADWAKPRGDVVELKAWPLRPESFVPGNKPSEFVTLYAPAFLRPAAYESQHVVEFCGQQYALAV